MSTVISPAYKPSASYRGQGESATDGSLTDEQLRTTPAPAHVRFLEWDLANPQERRALLQQGSSQGEEDADSSHSGSSNNPSQPHTLENLFEPPPQQAYPEQSPDTPLAPGAGGVAADATNLKPGDLTRNILVGPANAASPNATQSTAGLTVRPTPNGDTATTYALTEDLRIHLNHGDTTGTFEQQINGEWVDTGITTDVTVYEASGAMSFKGVSESEAEQLFESNLFSRLDTDGDNQLNHQELKDGQAANLVGFKGHVLTAKEWDRASNELFGGETISRETFEQQRDVFTPASKESFEAYNRFIQIDTDGDGQLSVEEIKQAQADNPLATSHNINRCKIPRITRVIPVN